MASSLTDNLANMDVAADFRCAACGKDKASMKCKKHHTRCTEEKKRFCNRECMKTSHEKKKYDDLLKKEKERGEKEFKKTHEKSAEIQITDESLKQESKK